MAEIGRGGLSGSLTDRERSRVFPSEERGGSDYPRGFGTEQKRGHNGPNSPRDIGMALVRGDAAEVAKMLEENKRSR